MRGVDRLVEAVQAVIEWEVEYREMNHLGTWPPRVFQEMAIARAAILSSTSEPGLPHGILCQCPKCLPSSGGTPVSKLLEVVCPACGYDFPPRVANYPNAHCPNCRHDFNYAVTNAAPSEPQASEPRRIVLTWNCPNGDHACNLRGYCVNKNCELFRPSKPQASEPRTYKGDLH